MEEAQAEAAESWHSGALRQLHQLERALHCAAAEVQNETAQVHILGVPAGPALTTFACGIAAAAIAGGVGLIYVQDQQYHTPAVEQTACICACGGSMNVTQPDLQHLDPTDALSSWNSGASWNTVDGSP